MNIATITAIICITILLSIALFKGIDGVALAGGVAIVAGLGGLAAKHIKKPPSPP